MQRTRPRSLTATIAATALAGILALTACGGGDAGAQGDETRSLTFGTSAEPATWDAALGDITFTANYYEAVYDRLIVRQSDGELTPGLAESWEYDDEQTTLTLELREGVTFTDDTPFNADAVVANLEHYRDANGPATADLALVDSIQATDEYTVDLGLSAPDPALLENLSFSIGHIMSPTAIESGDIASHPVGTGPYTLDETQTTIGSQYVFQANPDNWRADEVQFQDLTILLLADQSAALNSLQAGQVDVTFLNDLQAAATAEEAGFTRLGTSPSWAGLVIFDRAGSVVPALGDQRVREAIQLAIDTESIKNAYLGGEEASEETAQVFGPSTEGYVPELDSANSFDPERAKELMAEAGYADGFSVTMPYYEVLGAGIMTSIESMLAEIGITVDYQSMSPSEVPPAILGGQFPMGMYTASYEGDWATMTTFLGDNAPFNPFGATDETAQGLIDDYQFGTDEERPAIAQELNEYVVDQAWYTMYGRGQASMFLNPDVVTAEAPQVGGLSLFDFQPVA
ncbi:peptide ABC transporter substrate-binding protein [Pseudoclavibacter endophyticus]|uniref:Solute-binding protein family 5 domain-containing protein n=1 Tax=Pseudoclavibacter endophyticus TaxID=1778590 RepID=A0A6H9WJL2_9MICO|nr:ABC transporter substrate-binding protein [Pseudoclavibacter endophyticus]KAB1649383.1 hypothetical protein F8O04_03695 [Pseudoclavibacter endophyticus]GGA63066.1 peptide ABC transporter substrate-binding protein [Pseudoclavibacter endophyticus]